MNILQSPLPPFHPHLQLCPTLRLLQNRLHPRRLHHIAPHLQVPTHKKPLRIRLARHQLPEILIAEYERDICLLALGRGALPYGSRLLQVDVPVFGLPVVLKLEREDGAAFFYGVFAVGGVGGEGLGD